MALVILVLGVLYDFYFILRLDTHEISKRSSFFPPMIVLMIVLSVSLYASLQIDKIWMGTAIWIELTIFGVIGFATGILSFTFPLSLQHKYLQLDLKKTQYERVKKDLDKKLDEITTQLFSVEEPSTKDISQRLDKIERALNGFFLVSYREVIISNTRADYFQYISPFIGPVIAILYSIIEKLITP
jgi:tetrahydromethanopterin S-methyltransferase subunit G/uncharacterized membrane protein (DUF485 family)